MATRSRCSPPPSPTFRSAGRGSRRGSRPARRTRPTPTTDRSGRTQQALFDVRPGTSTGYDEFIDSAGNVRPAWQGLAECVGERGRGGLAALRTTVRSLVDNDGITYIEVDQQSGDAVTNGDG